MPLAVITGATSGIGRAAARAMGRRGYHVVVAGRSDRRAARTISTIEAEGGTAEFLTLDLASLEASRDAARKLESAGRTVDVLVNNAGVGATRGISPDGFEIHFAVNHLGHFMFTHHLRRAFRPGTRIVQVTSSVHFRATALDFARLRGRSQSFYGLDEYAMSKLANVLFVREMARRQPDWHTYAVHPGLTDTGILPWYARPFMRRRLLSPDEGAETVVWCATSEELTDQSGLYYAKCQAAEPSPLAQDDELARELWRRSELWCDVAPLH